ncbi:MAG: hypothetical protein KDC28_01615 [Saprospiraceae bacterium]|nr:hypothetical protein [Saprospiraceae bacterium]
MRLFLIFFLFSIVACSNGPKNDQSPASGQSEVDLMALLDTIWRTEQEPIRLRDSLGRVYGFESDEFQKQNEIYHKNHVINEKKVIDILDNIGWPGQDIIGEDGNRTICNVLQHSDYEVREKYLPMMRDAVKAQKLQPRLLARAEDRLATDRGELQVYGGQIKYYPETKSFDVWPIVDPQNVDKRRAEIGLEPIAESLSNRSNPLEWNLEEQIKRTEAFEKERLNGSE